ncbi:GGDEF domain-containing protein [Gordonia sp. TBRC 11910]|uniref:GGDEF domain-containing protein n=1 Tax=Gordonia asplenii TaxID=2725283 RepID=A0A848KQ36_9ACTN|nr:GGDEF domain-containing protein [Gordonia asplenii]NMO00139.1 GGDEF domain-containing protein [Gordonia asplenii]
MLIAAFDDPATEERFRQSFYADGRRLRLEAWTAVSIFSLIVGAYLTFFSPAESDRSTLGPLFLVAVALSSGLGFASQARPLHRRISAALFVGAVGLQVAVLMATRIVLYRAGHDPLPVTYPIALSLVLIVTQLRLIIVAPVIITFAAAISVTEALTIPMGVVERNTVVLGCAIAVAALVSVHRVEITSRRTFDADRTYCALANTDSLTSIPNRRHAEQRLRAAVCSPEMAPVSLAILDLDDFKAFNDSHGHPAGDARLRSIATALQDAAKPDDFVARHAGEEFTVLFCRTTPADARLRTEALRAKVATVSAADSVERSTTASAGVATLVGTCPDDAADETAQSLTRAADQALYQAKATGRDKTVAPVACVPTAAGSSRRKRARGADDISTVSNLRARCGRMRFADPPLEAQFREQFERHGCGSRLVLAMATLAAFAVTITVQTFLITDLTAHDQMIRIALIGCDAAGLVLAMAVARMRPRRFGPQLHILAMAVVIAGLMTQRLVVPVGTDLVPLLAPVAILVSLALVQIRHVVLLPSIAVLGAGVLGAEMWVLPGDAERFIAVGVGAIVIIIVARFSFAMERLLRIDWERTRILDELGRTDLVTGLPNRRAFIDALRARLSGSEPVALLLLDVDHLKAYNDRFGHAAGDRFLAATGSALAAAIGPADTVARVGGEEFAALLVGPPVGSGESADADHWARRADWVRAAIGGGSERSGEMRGAVTASAGLAIARPSTGLDDLDAVIDDLFERADRALYQAKHRGRNRVVVAPARVSAVDESGPTLVG